MTDFLIIGPFGSVCCYNIFHCIKDDEIFIGYNRVGEFIGDLSANAVWYSSFYVDDREFLVLKEYREGDYKEYDHFKAINCDRTADIPDYDGIIGVPVTFLEKYNRKQFKIVDARDYRKDDKFKDMDVQMLSGSGGMLAAIDGRPMYSRILIRKK